jgi:threonine dehydrogenase-like Zn-dependent dehydrogenase
MTLDQAVLAEPLSVGLYTVRLAGLTPDLAAGIFGSGPIGLSVLLAAKAVAPGRMYVTDLIDRRLEAARACGANWTCNAAAADVAHEMLAREPAGLDVVFECSGDPRSIDQAMAALKPGGMLVIVGIPAQKRVDFDVHVMRRKELTFKNVRRQRGCVTPVLELVADRRLSPDPMLTHRFPLAAAEQAFELVAGYADGVIKAVIELHGE